MMMSKAFLNCKPFGREGMKPTEWIPLVGSLVFSGRVAGALFGKIVFSPVKGDKNFVL